MLSDVRFFFYIPSNDGFKKCSLAVHCVVIAQLSPVGGVRGESRRAGQVCCRKPKVAYALLICAYLMFLISRWRCVAVFFLPLIERTHHFEVKEEGMFRQ